ncbi:MAG: hypothetical protein KH149_02520, partial [Clostridiales bacterium]|nr:hypothetical protein [Clostridiales bacterium]
VRPFFYSLQAVLPRGNPPAVPFLPHLPSRRRQARPFFYSLQAVLPRKGAFVFSSPAHLWVFSVSAHLFFPICFQIPYLLLISQFSGLFPFLAVQYLCSTHIFSIL